MQDHDVSCALRCSPLVKSEFMLPRDIYHIAKAAILGGKKEYTSALGREEWP
jgi:hypothetical protein